MIYTHDDLDFIESLNKQINSLPHEEYDFLNREKKEKQVSTLYKFIEEKTAHQTHLTQRILDEYLGYGPLSAIFSDESISEILVNGPNSIWIEKHGQLQEHSDIFYSALTYKNILDRICTTANIFTTTEHPVCDGSLDEFRICLVAGDLTHQYPQYSLRRHPKNPWSFEKLQNQGWTSEAKIDLIKDILKRKENFLIVGPTGCGKTSVINACMQEFATNERALIIEDTNELSLPNSVSSKLIARKDPQNILPEISQTDLIRTALRLRPDRIIMGEIRGNESKDFLMSLATGHGGSFGTIHAENPAQALIRLEMLIQMAAPQWNLQAIRKLIHLSLKYIVTLERTKEGARRLKSIYQINSLEDSGFLLDSLTEGLP